MVLSFYGQNLFLFPERRFTCRHGSKAKRRRLAVTMAVMYYKSECKAWKNSKSRE